MRTGTDYGRVIDGLGFSQSLISLLLLLVGPVEFDDWRDGRKATDNRTNIVPLRVSMGLVVDLNRGCVTLKTDYCLPVRPRNAYW